MIVRQPGILTTFQDRGRYGFQKYGVLVNGAMDMFALRVANILVGNSQDEAALEITLHGPSIELTEDITFAICGAQLSPMLNGSSVSEWRRISAKAGNLLSFGKPASGCRAYLAVAGGFDVPEVMGSRSTYLRGQIGGFEGRALKQGDELKVRQTDLKGSVLKVAVLDENSGLDWFVSPTLFPAYGPHPVVRFIPGPDFRLFSAESQRLFGTESFKITPQSDRMGYRLSGPTLELASRQEKVSTAVTVGTIQVPPDGNPIILMADRQTIGGYPCIAQVIQVDVPVLAQLKPGDSLTFQEVTLELAQELWREREMNIRILEQAVCNQSKGQ
ncbi:MAG: 5-oxoprolinase subunit C family protein [Bacilli bacterium]